MNKILIIEDDAFLSELYYMTFTYAGFEVERARDGVEGVEKTKQVHPDLIFLDIMMPKKNGIETLTEIKQDDTVKDIPIVILSNFSNEDQKDEAIQKGAYTFIIKSNYEPNEVVALAKQILAKKDNPQN